MLATNKIHIQAGTLKGRRILFPDRPGLRPATGEMRETLFNWLRPLHGDKVLDAYCGSGALSFEALSQGASLVHAFELDKTACSYIQQTLDQLPPLNFSLTQGDFRKYWSNAIEYDLIFLDPPYASDLLNEALAFLLDRITANTKVFIHYPQNNTPKLDAWQIIKDKKRNRRHYALLQSTKKIEKHR